MKKQSNQLFHLIEMTLTIVQEELDTLMLLLEGKSSVAVTKSKGQSSRGGGDVNEPIFS